MAKIIIRKGFVSHGGRLYKAGDVIDVADAKRMVARSGGDFDFYHGGEIPAKDEASTVMATCEASGTRGTLLHSTFLIFEDGTPQEYRNDPVFKHLFVPPERLDQARKEIGRTGSFRSIYYQRALDKKGGE